MKNHYPGLLAFLCFLFLSPANILFAQCAPNLSQTCNATNLLCALDELNGLVCSNTSPIPSSCSPICSQGGIAENTSWWGFMGNGGNVSITLDVGACNNNQGLEFGILRGCNCSTPVGCKSLPCVSPGSSWTINASVQKCVSYYLWIDGCNADVCDFTISTTGGAVATLEPLGFINNVTSGVIEACLGACNYHFFVDEKNDGCFVRYLWTLDGAYINSERNTYLDLPKEGDFELCVTQELLNSKDQTVCAQETKCATIRVQKSPDRFGPPRNICWESAFPKGYKWFNQTIYSTGEYRQKLSDATCCSYDSIVQFNVLDKPQPEVVYYISCDNSPYTDILGRKHSPCLFFKEITLQKTSSPYKCDSSIFLTALNVNYTPSWSVNCLGTQVELLPNIKILFPCNAGETYEFDYSWYLKNDSTKLISKDERLLVPAANEDYILKVDVIANIGSESAICTKTFYESINEGNVTPECFPVAGSKVYCFDPVGEYWIDGFIQTPVNFYNWTVVGGQIISNPDSQSVKVSWNLNAGDTGKICASYNVECGMSCEKCIDVLFESKIAGEDFAQRSLTAYLDAKAHPNGTWKLISGPNQVHLFEPMNPRTKVSAFNYGYYCFEWSVTDNNCTLRDTLCVDFYFAKKASPDYPVSGFERRNRTVVHKVESSLEINTPTLINSNGKTKVSIYSNEPKTLHYHWFDLYGRKINHDVISLSPGLHSYEIVSPVDAGIYFLSVKSEDFQNLLKVCVMD
ncbi:MAG: hypothetical protein IPM92_08890 [Saprospiraceae bacterium]|nr:hypothetical protein [Saprospiraceae bacterium]